MCVTHARFSLSKAVASALLPLGAVVHFGSVPTVPPKGNGRGGGGVNIRTKTNEPICPRPRAQITRCRTCAEHVSKQRYGTEQETIEEKAARRQTIAAFLGARDVEQTEPAANTDDVISSSVDVSSLCSYLHVGSLRLGRMNSYSSVWVPDEPGESRCL